MVEINIGKDFARYPSGRYLAEDGPFCGEAFRENILWPAIAKLEENEKLKVILDDHVDGYGSSFLTEGFAGIVKYGYMTSDRLVEALIFEFSDDDFEFYKKKIIQYIQEAQYSSKSYPG